jgi:hypothetical protein
MTSSTASHNITFPTVEDFRRGGRFFNIRNLSKQKDLPLAIKLYVFPDYTKTLFEPENRITKKCLDNIKIICLQYKMEVLKEERLKREKNDKELETRRMEDEIRKYFDVYYKNYYKSKVCDTCKEKL